MFKQCWFFSKNEPIARSSVVFLRIGLPNCIVWTRDLASGLHMWSLIYCLVIIYAARYVWSVNCSTFQSFRPSVENLPEDLALIVTSCWKEDPNDRPDFTQIIRMLLHYVSTISPPEPMIPPRIFPTENTVFPPESPGTSALMPSSDSSTQTPSTQMMVNQQQSRGFFFCFSRCYWSTHPVKNLSKTVKGIVFSSFGIKCRLTWLS